MARVKKQRPKPGERYGKLVVLGEQFIVNNGVRKSGAPRREPMCVCQCDCGVVVARATDNLHGRAVCFNDCPFKGRKKPGKTSRPLYNTWNSILYRCYNPKCPAYHNYGGRGIGACREWRDSFEVFEEWAASSGWASGLEIDRINNDGDYEPTNCRWVTATENARNKRTNLFITACGERKTAAEWAEDSRCVVSAPVLRGRIHAGWDADAALTTPRSQCIT